MKSKEEIAKLVCGEKYSLNMLAEKGFYFTDDIIQINSRQCISRGEIDKVFQPEKIILDFCEKRNIIIDTSKPNGRGADGYMLEKDPIEQTKKVLGIMQSAFFLGKNMHETFTNMQPYTKKMLQKFGYDVEDWVYRVSVGKNESHLTEEDKEYLRTNMEEVYELIMKNKDKIKKDIVNKDTPTKEERNLFKGYLTEKEAFELSRVMNFYLSISMIACYKEKIHKDYIMIYKDAVNLYESRLLAIKNLGADITECVDENGKQVLFIDLRNFRADRESMLDINLVKKFLPDIEVADGQR